MLTITVPFARSLLEMHTKENSTGTLKRAVRYLIILIGILYPFIRSKQRAQITRLTPAARDSPAPSHWPAPCPPPRPRTPCQEEDWWYDLAYTGQLPPAHPATRGTPSSQRAPFPVSFSIRGHLPEAVPPRAAKQRWGLVCWAKPDGSLQDLLNTLTRSISPWSREEATAWLCRSTRRGPRERANPCPSLRLSE